MTKTATRKLPLQRMTRTNVLYTHQGFERKAFLNYNISAGCIASLPFLLVWLLASLFLILYIELSRLLHVFRVAETYNPTIWVYMGPNQSAAIFISATGVAVAETTAAAATQAAGTVVAFDSAITTACITQLFQSPILLRDPDHTKSYTK